jgi:hypothetical protein
MKTKRPLFETYFILILERVDEQMKPLLPYFNLFFCSPYHYVPCKQLSSWAIKFLVNYGKLFGLHKMATLSPSNCLLLSLGMKVHTIVQTSEV